MRPGCCSNGRQNLIHMEKEFIMIMERMFDNAILASGSEWIWIAAVIIIILVIVIVIVII